MITWINFLHIYQPPTQTKEVVDQIVKESYTLIPKLLTDFPNLTLTVNIAGSLIELFEKYEHTDVLKEYKELAEAGRIELVGSAMYHPLLALLPESEIEHQIVLNNEKLKKYFGELYKPKGFFIPEMAYSKKVADVVKKMGFEWIIIDDMSFPNGKPNPEVRYTIKDNGLSVVFRDRLFSKTFPPHYIVEFGDQIKHPYIVIAHDGELYGHWHKDDQGYYAKAFNSAHIGFKKVSEYLAELKETEEIAPREASWESLPEELANNNPYALWNDPANHIHKALWAYTDFAIKTLAANSADKNYSWARLYIDRGLASCAWWWATSRQLTQSTTMCWNPTEIEKGAQELLTAVRSLQQVPAEVMVKAEQDFSNLRTMIWKHHWEHHYKPA